MYTIDEIKTANSTSRHSTAIGYSVIVPKYVRSFLKKDLAILDFGAGKHAIHALQFKQEGYNITAYEFGENLVEGIHDPQALSRTYDIVYASNVLNVQSTPRMLDFTILQLQRAMNQTGILIANYPLEPRKLSMNSKDMAYYLGLHFSSVEILNTCKCKPVFLLKR